MYIKYINKVFATKLMYGAFLWKTSFSGKHV